MIAIRLLSKRNIGVLLIVGLLLSIAVAYIVITKDNRTHPANVNSQTTGGGAAPLRNDTSTAPSQQNGIGLGSQNQQLIAQWRALAKTDVRAAFEQTKAIASKSQRRALKVGLAKAILADDFTKIGAVAESLETAEEWDAVFATSVQAAIKSDPEGTLRALRTQLRGGALNDATRFAVSALVDLNDFTRAMETQLAMPFSDDRDMAITTIAGKLAPLNFELALQWIAKLDPSGEQPRALSWVQDDLANRGQVSNLQRLLPLISNKTQRESAVRVIASKYAADGNSSQLQAFTESLSPAERQWAEASALNADRASSFGDKINKATQIQNAAVRAEFVSNAVTQEVLRDPQKVAASIPSMPADVRSVAVPALVSSWVRQDSEALSVWVQQLPQGQLRDSAASNLAMNLRLIDKESAKSAASWIGDSKLRERIQKQIH